MRAGGQCRVQSKENLEPDSAAAMVKTEVAPYPWGLVHLSLV